MNYSDGDTGNYGRNPKYIKHPGTQKLPTQVSCVDPYVVSALRTLIGKKLVIETVRGSQHGKLVDVKPDHIVLEVNGDSRFFIRIAKIVHIMPVT